MNPLQWAISKIDQMSPYGQAIITCGTIPLLSNLILAIKDRQLRQRIQDSHFDPTEILDKLKKAEEIKLLKPQPNVPQTAKKEDLEAPQAKRKWFQFNKNKTKPKNLPPKPEEPIQQPEPTKQEEPAPDYREIVGALRKAEKHYRNLKDYSNFSIVARCGLNLLPTVALVAAVAASVFYAHFVLAGFATACLVSEIYLRQSIYFSSRKILANMKTYESQVDQLKDWEILKKEKEIKEDISLKDLVNGAFDLFF